MELSMRNMVLAASVAVLLTATAHADEWGHATYYTNPRHHGMIAAHKTLPFGTHVRVHNLDNGRSADVVIVDRGPYARGRIIDVSTEAAGLLGFRAAGVARVRLERLGEARMSDDFATRVSSLPPAIASR
jgi:rare lipoprotein A